MSLEALQDNLNKKADDQLKADVDKVFDPFRQMFGDELFKIYRPDMSDEPRASVCSALNGHGVILDVKKEYIEKMRPRYRQRIAEEFMREVEELKNRVESLEQSVQL